MQQSLEALPAGVDCLCHLPLPVISIWRQEPELGPSGGLPSVSKGCGRRGVMEFVTDPQSSGARWATPQLAFCCHRCPPPPL